MSKLSLKPIWVVLCVMLGTTTVSLNNSMVNPAIPVLMTVFELTPVLATWIMASFMATMGITMPLTHYLSLRFGRNTLYLAGASLFLLGSLVGCLATSITWLLLARSIQGVASGLMIPLSLALIYSVYAKHERGAITGLWGAAVMLSPALGPLFGSLLLTFFSWQALFLVNLPLVLLTLLLGAHILPSSTPDKTQKFDGVGYVLIALGLGAILIATGQMRSFDVSREAYYLVALVLGGGLLGAFVWRSLHHASPLLNVRLFQVKGYRSSVVIAVVQAIGMFESLLLLPLLIQVVLGYHPIFTGVMLLITALSASFFGHLGGKWLDRHGPNRMVSLGLMLTGMGTAGFALIDAHTPLWSLVACALLRGAGVGLSYMPITSAGISALPDSMVTQGAVMNNISRRLSASLSLLFGAIWIQSHSVGLLDTGSTSYASAIGDVFIALGGLSLLVIPFAWCFPRVDAMKLLPEPTSSSALYPNNTQIRTH